MKNLPEKFPEHIIMYKTLSRKILQLKDEKEKLDKDELEKVQKKIKKYESEAKKIKNMFPENFFDVYLAEK